MKLYRLAAIVTMALWLGGCTGGASLTWGPDGYRHDTTAHRDQPPAKWYTGADLGLRND